MQLNEGRPFDVAQMAAVQQHQVVSYGIGSRHVGAASEVKDAVDFLQIGQTDAGRRQRREGRRTTRCAMKDDVTRLGLALNVDDALRAGDTVFVGQRVACQRHMDALEPDAVAFLGVDLPLDDQVSQHILKRLGHALRRLATTDNVDAADRRKIKDNRFSAGRVRQSGVADNQPATFQTYDLAYVPVGIGCSQPCLEHIQDNSPSGSVAMFQQSIVVVDDQRCNPHLD